MNQLVTQVFVEQPLALPGSAKTLKITLKLFHKSLSVKKPLIPQRLLGAEELSFL